MKLKLDLHRVFSNSDAIDAALREVLDEAIDKHAEYVEIIPGKGSGQLKKSVLRFLEKNYKGRYHRIEKDDKNFGRLFVHFRWK
ncbi:MAG: Smr/MutS family protein [Candidatus Omnitrophica bacterium]|nr:Smr/MutS family protein [Candidatus Omnitrophota bacterium]